MRRSPLLPAAVLLACAAVLLAGRNGLLGFVLSTTTSTVAPASHLAGRGLAAVSPASRVALRAEVVDAEVTSEEPEPEDDEMGEELEPARSIFDGPQSDMFKRKYDGHWYEVFRSNWTYRRANNHSKTGSWERGFNMPAGAFARERPRLLQKWRHKKRRLRLKHGMGQRYPNGKLIFLTKLQGHPFTREFYGEKYAGQAEWHYSPKEIEGRERQLRAHALKRRLEQEAEETRVARMRELNVWLGEEGWRRPWQAKAEYRPVDKRRQKQK